MVDSKAYHPTIIDFVLLTAIATLFLFFGISYNRSTPLWNPPDEERHFAYSEYIARTHQLPQPLPGATGELVTQAFHPPLYYLITSMVCDHTPPSLPELLTVDDGPGFITIKCPTEMNPSCLRKAMSAYRIRLLSLIMSTLTLCFMYAIVLVIFPGERILAFASTLFAGMNPQFIHISASVSNENLCTLFSTFYLLVLTIYLKKPRTIPYPSLSGMVLGCCLLSKTSTLFHLPLTMCVIAWVYRHNKTQMCINLLMVLTIATAVAGWWYGRNWLLYNDPLLSKFLISYQPWGIRRSPLSPDDIITIVKHTFTSFWGNFGAMQIPLPFPYVLIYGGIMVLGAAGYIRELSGRKLQTFQKQALGIHCSALIGTLVLFVFLNRTYHGVYMGRYFFVVLASIVTLTFAGIRILTTTWRTPLLIILSLWVILLNWVVFTRVLQPAYAAPLLNEGIDQPLFSHPTNELSEQTTIEQSFLSPKNNLCAIRVMFSTVKKPLSGAITFSLRENDNPTTTLYHIELPLKNIEDCARYFFIFPPLKDSANKKYIMRFSTSSHPYHGGISLWYEPRDVYPEGEMLMNGKPSRGDLYFTIYSFTGDHPQTIWQGKKETVISQGLYVDIRELQLYYEKSKNIREKSITHEKWMRLDQAVKNRKLLTRGKN